MDIIIKHMQSRTHPDRGEIGREGIRKGSFILPAIRRIVKKYSLSYFTVFLGNTKVSASDIKGIRYDGKSRITIIDLKHGD